MSFWVYFKGENVTLFLEATTLKGLEGVIARQMAKWKKEPNCVTVMMSVREVKTMEYVSRDTILNVVCKKEYKQILKRRREV